MLRCAAFLRHYYVRQVLIIPHYLRFARLCPKTFFKIVRILTFYRGPSQFKGGCYEKVFIFINAVLFGFVSVSSIPIEAQAKSTFVTIGTGGVTGVYYVVGGAVGKIVDQKRMYTISGVNS